MDMKLRGMYIARQLSFHGVTFKIEEVPLSQSFEKVYDESVELVGVTFVRVCLVPHANPCYFNVFCSGWKPCKSSPRPPS